jgi:hypothetical protein
VETIELKEAAVRKLNTLATTGGDLADHLLLSTNGRTRGSSPQMALQRQWKPFLKQLEFAIELKAHQ